MRNAIKCVPDGLEQIENIKVAGLLWAVREHESGIRTRLLMEKV